MIVNKKRGMDMTNKQFEETIQIGFGLFKERDEKSMTRRAGEFACMELGFM